MRQRLERYFEFAALGTSWRTEITAGITTFATMAYIIFVNPSILAQAGMPAAAVMAATCVSAGLASILMGVAARYPLALAPGMGLNAYFALAVCVGMVVPWRTALGAVFLSGLAFALLTAIGLRERLVSALPRPLYAAVAAGIGLFIALIGLRNAGLVVASPATLVTLGNPRDPNTALAVFGLVVTAALLARRVRAAILVGIVCTTAAGFAAGLVKWTPTWPNPADWTGAAFQLDIAGAVRLGMLEILFVFLFVDLFDNLGTLVAVTKRAGLLGAAGSIPRVNRILYVDSAATMIGALAGTSTVVSYIESAAGIAVGGRSGVTAVVVGLLFLASIVLAPLAGAIPAAATAPALILVGAAMMEHASEVDWRDARVSIPAFLTIVMIPFTFSIATGLAAGFTLYVAVMAASGRGRELSGLAIALAGLFIARFLYLAQG